MSLEAFFLGVASGITANYLFEFLRRQSFSRSLRATGLVLSVAILALLTVFWLFLAVGTFATASRPEDGFFGIIFLLLSPGCWMLGRRQVLRDRERKEMEKRDTKANSIRILTEVRSKLNKLEQNIENCWELEPIVD